MSDLLLQLIQYSIDRRNSLTVIPSAEEWEILFESSCKQAIAGVCFSGLSELFASRAESVSFLPESLYYRWAGMAFEIQRRNDSMNAACSSLLGELSGMGLRSCILKGQGAALNYGQLAELRNPGDIDIWVDADKDAVVAAAARLGITDTPSYLHVCTSFSGIPVELHFRPTYCRQASYNRKMQDFCKRHTSDWSQIDGLVVPSWYFNSVYMPSHIFRHLFGFGVGLRQLMDYYFLLINRPDDVILSDLDADLCAVGLRPFIGALMFIMKEVFLIDDGCLICAPDRERGAALLSDVMEYGNFGQMDCKSRKTIGHYGRLLRMYPYEMLSLPVWKLRRSFD